MARKYEVNFMVRTVNRLMAGMIRINFAPPGMALLTVRGRKTGKTYSAPVTLIEHDGKRWLVSPYGEVNWVQNARAAGQVTLLRKGVDETLRIQELGPQESAPILKEYLAQVGVVRPYFDVPPEAPVTDFEAEAPRHPVFLLEKA